MLSLIQQVFLQKNEMKFFITLFTIALTQAVALSQATFDYTLEIIPKNIKGLPGVHSYACGQSNGKWLIIGGRRDGLHARQPFNAFPAANNNTDIFVVDPQTLQFWSAPLSDLDPALKEQLQSTNMNFHQDNDTLIIIGGYCFSATSNSYKTFSNLTTVNVSGLINAVINGSAIAPFFKQMSDPNFALCGGQLGKIGDTFYLVGGHKFDGQYNPMGNPTYTQTYSNQIRTFSLNNSGSTPVVTNYNSITDAVNLHRRDYNLLPQIFPDGTEGFTISSGVFQINSDLPFLYPVDIKGTTITPQTSFNQYLSNYHCAKAVLYDSIENATHSLFFGGMSRYYHQNGNQVQDDNVPFVKTISRLSRDASGNLSEHLLNIEMPAYQGASAEFFMNKSLPQTKSEIIKLSSINTDTIVIGHIFGGISSPTINPFSNNQTNTTSADNSIFEVRLIKKKFTGLEQTPLNGSNPYDFTIFPIPANDIIRVKFENKVPGRVYYLLTNMAGQLVQNGNFNVNFTGQVDGNIPLETKAESGTYVLTLVFEDKFYVSKSLIIN